MPISAHLRPRNAKNHQVSIFKDPKGLPILIISLNIIQPINFNQISLKQNNNFAAQYVVFFKIWKELDKNLVIEPATELTKN